MSASNGLAVIQPGEIVAVDEWTDARKEFIRKAFCGGADDITAATFLALCERRRLSPEARHVYLVNRAAKGKPANWVIQTGIDGYRLIADRTGRYVGSDDPVFIHDPDGRVAIATVTVRKLVSGHVGTFTASARWDEYAVEWGDLWKRMPHTMLAKCAEALALRKAFPEELSGMYTDAEMDQAENPPASTPPAATSSLGQGSPEPAKERIVDWSVFWADLRSRNIDAATYESIVGKKANTFTDPQEALDALKDAEAGIAAEHGDAIDGEYKEVPVDSQPTVQNSGAPATPRQINFILGLTKELGMKVQGPDGDYHADETALTAVVGVDFESDWPHITRQTASDIIKSFQDQIKARQQQGELIPGVRDHTR